MNAAERKWIKKQLYKILVEDLDPELALDSQADDIIDFLSNLEAYVTYYPNYKL